MTGERTLLLIDKNPAHAEVFREALLKANNGPFHGEWVQTLSQSMEKLREKTIWAIFASLSLPDSQGLDTIEKLLLAAPGIPILVMGGIEDEDLSTEALRLGAKDYLLEGHIDRYSFDRAIRNMAERKTVEEVLFIEKERASVTLNSIGDAVLSTDTLGNVTYLNDVAERMTGWHREEAIGKPLAVVFRIIDGSTRETARDPMEMAVEQNRTVGLTVNCILIRRDGFESAIEDSAAPIHDRAGRITGAVIVFHDVSAARAMSVQMTHSAQHDVVTNLPNRLLLNDRITQSIVSGRRRNRPIAVLFLDLDRFKYINDSLGHATGDKLLQSVSKRLLASVRASDTVSRLGGDEFVILLSEIAHPEDAATASKKILLSLNSPHAIAGKDLIVDGSIGISVSPADGEDAETLIKNADTAMYHAKENGRNNFQFFKPEMNLKAVERQSLEGSLRRALEREEFLLHYQPKVNLDTGEITGVEALIRWLQPDRGLVPPSQFVPIAEDCGLIVQIGRWVLREACRQARAWQDAGLPPLPIAVNVSAVEFRDRGFVESVRAILSETGLEPRYLELEVTEGVLMEDGESTASVLQELKMIGICIAIDDFGTGFSSLSYLTKFPIDTLKIDQSFVRQVSCTPNETTVVTAMISMGQGLKLRVVAEGVETYEELEFLRAHNCNEAQGFYFSRPTLPHTFAKLLANGIPSTVLGFQAKGA